MIKTCRLSENTEIHQVASIAARDAEVPSEVLLPSTPPKLWSMYFIKEIRLDNKKSTLKDKSLKRIRMKLQSNLQYLTLMKRSARYHLTAYPNTATTWLTFMKIIKTIIMDKIRRRARITKFKTKLILTHKTSWATRVSRYSKTTAIA